MLRIHNSTTGKKEFFSPIDQNNVRLYFCGPTVYDRIHIGNLRAFMTADLLVRTLRLIYTNVTFVRNITDIDDKIMNRANENNESIRSLTKRTIKMFHEDIDAIGLIKPDIEPRATEHIPEMIKMVRTLIERGHAYEVRTEEGVTVYFDTSSYSGHGSLSGRDKMQGLSHLDADETRLKKNPDDFVLWKPSASDQPGWKTPWGYSRPGWHLECSAMSRKHLGERFDIHGGGHDLMFPHHENENAQSVCSSHNHEDTMANYWVHNAMLTIDGQKMSKSAGNFLTIRDLVDKIHPEVIRFFLLSVNYRTNLSFTWENIEHTKKMLDRFYRASNATEKTHDVELSGRARDIIMNDLDSPALISLMASLSNDAFNGNEKAEEELYGIGTFLGLFKDKQWGKVDDVWVLDLIEKRNMLRTQKKFGEADKIRETLKEAGVILEDKPDGSTIYRR